MYQLFVPFFLLLNFSIASIYYNLFICLSLDRYSACFQFLAPMEVTVINIFIHVFWWTYVFTSLGQMPRTESAGRQVSLLNFIDIDIFSRGWCQFTFPGVVDERVLIVPHAPNT